MALLIIGTAGNRPFARWLSSLPEATPKGKVAVLSSAELWLCLLTGQRALDFENDPAVRSELGNEGNER